MDGERLLDNVDTPHELRLLPEADLAQLAHELREKTIAAVSVTGGHLGSGLGVVELTIALHYVFNTPDDKLIWDVGHQAYPHKILTGRRDRIRTLRKGGGLSGFTKRAESIYDPFGAAHSSTSISAAMGMAIARDMKGEDRNVIAVIGDGALSAGMAYEAINHAGTHGERLIVVLNDNNMSISTPVGAMSTYLTRLPNRHDAQDTLFENMGFTYIGCVDGHDLAQLLPALRQAKAATGPVLLHVITQKGKGYTPAQSAADRYHGVVSFEVSTGKQFKATSNAPSFTKVFGESLIAEARKDDRIIGITAAMASGTGIDLFQREFPKRTFDVGIAEQHAVTFAAGLAAEGMRPFCAIYSTFLQRGYDQVVHDVAIQNLPVRFALDRAGLVGADGPTHAGSFDIAYLGCLPNFTLMAAADEAELVHMVATAAAHDSGPIAFRFPRGEGTGVDLPAVGIPLPIGRGRILREGSDVAILSYGTRLSEALKAAEELETMNISVTVADARFAKPLDTQMVADLARSHEALITVEEGAVGGFGTQVLHWLANAGFMDRGLKIRVMTLPDLFIDHDKPETMYARAGLDAAALVKQVVAILAPSQKSRVQHSRGIKAHVAELSK